MTDRKTLGKPWLVWLGVTILSQLYFLIQVLFFFDVVAWAPNWVRVLTYEEWNWMVENQGTYRYLPELDGLERLSFLLILFFAAAIAVAGAAVGRARSRA